MDFGDSRLPDRFWDKVFPEPNTGCWLWGGATSQKGYGQFRINRRTVAAHRMAVVLQAGMEPDHLCRQRSCVNPLHLEEVTPDENKRRAAHVPKTHCPRNHELTEDNTYRYTDGRRTCKKCMKAFNNQHYAYKTYKENISE